MRVRRHSNVPGRPSFFFLSLSLSPTCGYFGTQLCRFVRPFFFRLLLLIGGRFFLVAQHLFVAPSFMGWPQEGRSLSGGLLEAVLHSRAGGHGCIKVKQKRMGNWHAMMSYRSTGRKANAKTVHGVTVGCGACRQAMRARTKIEPDDLHCAVPLFATQAVVATHENHRVKQSKVGIQMHRKP